MLRKVRKHLIITGRVQGVGFRAFLRKQASNNQINGWVRNKTDGSVEVVLEGEKESVEDIISKAKKGPGWARVDNVEVITETYKGELNQFYIK